MPLCVSSSGSGTRFEVLVPHARGRGSDGFETYDLSGRGQQQRSADFETYDLSGKGQQHRNAGRFSSPPPRGSSDGRKGQGTGKEPLSLEACRQGIARGASLPPHRLVYFIWSLASRVKWEREQGVSLSNDRNDIVADVQESARLLLGNMQTSSSFPVMQLDQQNLTQLSWAIAVLVNFDARALSTDVRQLCYALAERAAQPGVLDANMAEACRGWAGVLFGLGKAGVKCMDDDHVQEVFRFALEEQLPDLLSMGQKCVPQDVSNVALACVYAEFEGNLERFISAVADRLRGRGTSNVMYNAKPQAVANVLLALAKLGWYDDGVVSKLAFAFVERISFSMPQELANSLWALSTLGWYDRAVYDELLWGLVKSASPKPQELSNAMYSCAMASHSGDAMDALARVVSKQNLSEWKAQDVCNTLYAWAVMSSLDMASADLSRMACTLFSEANSRGIAFQDPQHLSQLSTAHMEAVRVGQQGGGLSTANGLQQAAEEQQKRWQAEIAQRSKASAAVKQAMAALQQAGFGVQLGARVGKDGYAVDLLVQCESCPDGLSLLVVRSDDFFNHPQGQLDGKAAAVHAQIRQRCAGLVLLGEDKVGQSDTVVGAVRKGLARASGRGGAESSSGSSSSSSSSSTAGNTHPPASPSDVSSQPPGLLQPKGRPPPSPGPRSAAAVPPQLKGKPQRKQ